MDRSEVKAIVDREVGPLMRKLGLPHWKIRVVYDLRRGDDESATRGECRYLVDYNRATIALDPDCFDEESEVVEILRHELFHLVLSPFQVVLDAMRPVLEKEPTLMAVMESVRVHATEKAVINLERMWYGMTHAVEPGPDGGAPGAIC